MGLYLGLYSKLYSAQPPITEDDPFPRPGPDSGHHRMLQKPPAEAPWSLVWTVFNRPIVSSIQQHVKATSTEICTLISYHSLCLWSMSNKWFHSDLPSHSQTKFSSPSHHTLRTFPLHKRSLLTKYTSSQEQIVLILSLYTRPSKQVDMHIMQNKKSLQVSISHIPSHFTIPLWRWPIYELLVPLFYLYVLTLK